MPHPTIASRRRGALLLAPAVLALGALYALPQLLLLPVSLGRRTPLGTVERALSLESYARALDPLYLTILARSVGLALVTTVACLLVGYPVAYWIARRVGPRWRSALLVAVVLPFWTSFLVRMYAWMFLLRDEGPLNLLLGTLGLPRLSLLYNDGGVLLGQLYGELPFMILPLYASLERLDGALLEAAADLGASPARRLWHVVLPLTRPGILAGCVLVFVPSLGAFLAPDVLGGARTAYLGNLVQGQFAVARDAPFGAALSFLLSLIVLALLFLFRSPLRAAGESGH